MSLFYLSYRLRIMKKITRNLKNRAVLKTARHAQDQI